MILQIPSIFQMKNIKKLLIVLAIFLFTSLAAGILGGCAPVAEVTIPPSNQEEPDIQKETTDGSISTIIKTDSGAYMGQADNNSIEIRISGVQDENLAFRVFKISDEVRPAFESLLLQKDDEVKFDYYEQEVGQPVLMKIERISN